VRVLLDENLPVDFASELPGHEVVTVQQMKWEGVKNGELLRRAAGQFQAFVTMDQNLPYQQNLPTIPIAVLLLRAPSNRCRTSAPSSRRFSPPWLTLSRARCDRLAPN